MSRSTYQGQLSTQLSYVGIMYLMLMNASSPPVCSSSYRVYMIRSPRFRRLRWLYSMLSPRFLLLFLKMLKIGRICL